MGRRRSYQELMNNVSLKHGITLGEDDPIMVLHTINAILAEDLSEGVDEVLVKLRSDLEALYQRWDSESKARAQRVIAAALTTSQEGLRTAMLDAGSEAAQVLEQASDTAISNFLNVGDRVALWLQICVAVNVLTIATICWGVFMLTRH